MVQLEGQFGHCYRYDDVDCQRYPAGSGLAGPDGHGARCGGQYADGHVDGDVDHRCGHDSSGGGDHVADVECHVDDDDGHDPLGGTASDNDVLLNVTWANNRGGSGTATGTTSWSVASIQLLPGSNVLTVTARDLTGNVRTAILTVTFNAPITYGQVAAYSFNEGAGATLSDASGNNNLGTVTNGTWSTTGKFGNALSFNGTSSRLFVNSSTSLNLTTGMTLMAWVNPANTTQTNNRTIMRRETNGYWLYAGRTSNTLRPGGGAVINGVTRSVATTTALAANTWSHVAMTYDGANVMLYVNGTLVSTRCGDGLDCQRHDAALDRRRPDR